MKVSFLCSYLVHSLFLLVMTHSVLCLTLYQILLFDLIFMLKTSNPPPPPHTFVSPLTYANAKQWEMLRSNGVGKRIAHWDT